MMDAVFFPKQSLKNGDKYDYSLMWMLALLLSFGLMMVYSASIAYAANAGGSKWFFFERQAYFLLGSLTIGIVLMRVSIARWKKLMPFILGASMLMLVLVLFAGREINGARRWIHLGPFNIQPTEIFKFAVILYFSSLFTRRAEIVKRLVLWRYPVALIGCCMALVMMEPDFGSFVVVMSIALGMLLLAGAPWHWFAGLTGGVLMTMVLLIVSAPYRVKRVMAFLDPWQDPQGAGYQLSHSLMAVGHGKWIGVGLGASIEKRFFLPEAHTDFIFAVIAEEFGVIGMALLVACYAWIVWRAACIGQQADRLDLPFGSYVAKGICIWLGVQSFFHIGVNIGMLPTKGLPLPLISYGGSSVGMMIIAMVVLLRVDYENRLKMRGFKVDSGV